MPAAMPYYAGSALVALFSILASADAADNRAISPEEMHSVYDEVKTPFKRGIVIPAPPGRMVDCPTVFQHEGRWLMVYIQLESDPVGYSTQLAESKDLLQWTTRGTILPRGPDDAWDSKQAAGGIALCDPNWGKGNRLEKFDDRFWLTYLGGDKPGYETPPLSVSVAWTANPSKPQPWTRAGSPVLRPSDPDAREFERGTLFKSHVFRDPSQTLGAPLVMFYNAASSKDGERIGIAISTNMMEWKRFGLGPVLENRSADGRTAGITGDPQIVRMGDLWVMFYFGAFWRPGAFDTFACSRDLVHWTKWTGPDLIAPSEPWDQQYAHKPWVLKHDGVVYHFYCAVGDRGRVIALATSKR